MKHMALLHVRELGEDVKALVLESTPPILSVGRRCMNNGYSFSRERDRYPTFTTKSGRVITLHVEGDIPYLRVKSPALIGHLALPGAEMRQTPMEKLRTSRYYRNPSLNQWT